MKCAFRNTVGHFTVTLTDKDGKTTHDITLTAEKARQTKAFNDACKHANVEPTFGNAVCFVREAFPFTQSQHRDELLMRLAEFKVNAEKAKDKPRKRNRKAKAA